MPTADLSVLLANYNHARYLPRALDAILSQSVRPREVIVVDDASTKDDSIAVLEGYARRDPVVRLVRNEQNLGVVPTYNKLIGLARGHYLLLAGADDYVLPGFFEWAVGELDRHPTAGLCCGYDTYVLGDAGEVRENPSGWCSRPEYFGPNEVARKIRCNLAAHAIVCRREAMVRAGGYRQELAWYSDWFAFLTIAFRHGLCHVPASLAVRTLGLAEQYSAAAGRGERHIAVLGAYLDLMRSPEYADVAPYFRRTGVATNFGTDLIRAAARRPDRWQPEVLGFLAGFAPDEYESLQADPDPEVRNLAAYFLEPCWRDTTIRRKELELEVIQLRELLEATRRAVPPPGAVGKLRWLAGMAAKRLRRAG